MRRAMIFGSVMASFNVEEFGTERVRRLTHDEINERFRAFKRMTHFERYRLKSRSSSSFELALCTLLVSQDKVLSSEVQDTEAHMFCPVCESNTSRNNSLS